VPFHNAFLVIMRMKAQPDHIFEMKNLCCRLISYGHLLLYAVQQLDMTVNWIRLEVDPCIYGTTMTMVDSYHYFLSSISST
jgi:hypothetical protein